SALFGDSYAREGLRSLSSAPPATPSSEDFTPDPASFWGARVPHGADAGHSDEIDPSDVEQEDPDAIDTAPTRVLTATEVSTPAD
ncbi:hypothetical protein C6A85_54340, partial [Mycobacterium sp. ITM-2017-0098]